MSLFKTLRNWEGWVFCLFVLLLSLFHKCQDKPHTTYLLANVSLSLIWRGMHSHKACTFLFTTSTLTLEFKSIQDIFKSLLYTHVYEYTAQKHILSQCDGSNLKFWHSGGWWHWNLMNIRLSCLYNEFQANLGYRVTNYLKITSWNMKVEEKSKSMNFWKSYWEAYYLMFP